jgi:purine-binding chemotaxis protein CheW
VLQTGVRMVGLLVDAVSDIISVDQDQIQPPPDVACDQVKTFVKGLLTIEDRMVSEIAVDRLLPDPEALAA